MEGLHAPQDATCLSYIREGCRRWPLRLSNIAATLGDLIGASQIMQGALEGGLAFTTTTLNQTNLSGSSSDSHGALHAPNNNNNLAVNSGGVMEGYLGILRGWYQGVVEQKTHWQATHTSLTQTLLPKTLETCKQVTAELDDLLKRFAHLETSLGEAIKAYSAAITSYQSNMGGSCMGLLTDPWLAERKLLSVCKQYALFKGGPWEDTLGRLASRTGLLERNTQDDLSTLFHLTIDANRLLDCTAFPRPHYSNTNLMEEDGHDLLNALKAILPAACQLFIDNGSLSVPTRTVVLEGQVWRRSRAGIKSWLLSHLPLKTTSTSSTSSNSGASSSLSTMAAGSGAPSKAAYAVLSGHAFMHLFDSAKAALDSATQPLISLCLLPSRIPDLNTSTAINDYRLDVEINDHNSNIFSVVAKSPSKKSVLLLQLRAGNSDEMHRWVDAIRGVIHTSSSYNATTRSISPNRQSNVIEESEEAVSLKKLSLSKQSPKKLTAQEAPSNYSEQTQNDGDYSSYHQHGSQVQEAYVPSPDDDNPWA